MTIYAIRHAKTNEVLFIETSKYNTTMMKQRLSDITTNKELLTLLSQGIDVIVEKLEEVNYSGVIKRVESWKNKLFNNKTTTNFNKKNRKTKKNEQQV